MEQSHISPNWFLSYYFLENDILYVVEHSYIAMTALFAKLYGANILRFGPSSFLTFKRLYQLYSLEPGTEFNM